MRKMTAELPSLVVFALSLPGMIERNWHQHPSAAIDLTKPRVFQGAVQQTSQHPAQMQLMLIFEAVNQMPHGVLRHVSSDGEIKMVLRVRAVTAAERIAHRPVVRLAAGAAKRWLDAWQGR